MRDKREIDSLLSIILIPWIDEALAHFKNMPTIAPAVGIYAYKRFGHADVYHKAEKAMVIYNSGQKLELSAFRAAYLGKVVVKEVQVVLLQPGPYSPHGLQLVSTESQLIDKTIELIKKYL